MSIWMLFIIPVFAALVMYFFFKHKAALWEYGVLLGVAFFFILISKLLITSSMTSDTEYWSEKGVRVKYEGAYDEWIKDECSYDCFCQTDDKGEEHCQTCWEDCSYMKQHSAHYTLYTESGKSYSISEDEYANIIQKWKTQKLIGKHSQARTFDHGIYEAYVPSGKPQLAECVVTSHSYENKIQAVNTDYEEISSSDAKTMGLFDYPEINGYKQESILGFGDKTKAEAKVIIDHINSELGPEKQLKVFILIFNNKSEDYGAKQEAYWKGGNKNEFVLTMSVDNNGRVQWAHPFSWCENGNLKFNIKSHAQSQSKLDLKELALYMKDELSDKFVRRQFAEFSYITVEPSTTAKTWTGILLLLITGFLTFLFVSNKHDNTLVKEKRRNY